MVDECTIGKYHRNQKTIAKNFKDSSGTTSVSRLLFDLHAVQIEERIDTARYHLLWHWVQSEPAKAFSVACLSAVHSFDSTSTTREIDANALFFATWQLKQPTLPPISFIFGLSEEGAIYSCGVRW